jgi:IS30 family transposase
LAVRPRLQRVVAAKLRADWAPQQIAAWLVRQYPDDRTIRVSHETIYRTLYVQARGGLKQELLRHLRRRRTMRRSGRASLAGDGRGQIVDAVSIAERPASVDDRALPGHWEGDLFAGKKHSQIATLVERQSRYVLLVRLRGRDTGSVVRALIRRVHHLPAGLMQSLTWDRGLERAAHASVHRVRVLQAVGDLLTSRDRIR